MKIVILAISLISAVAFAETATLTIEGMHCAGCKSMITEKVCEEASAKTQYESCKVELIDAKKHIGQLTIVTKKDAKLDLTAVKANVKTAGSDYKVTQEIVK